MKANLLNSNTVGSVSRRDLLRAGSLACSSLGLANLLQWRAEATATQPSRRQKSVIMIDLLGGPSHIDMYDMKPDAPEEYRGEFLLAKSNVPGMEMCELMPQQSRLADKLAIVRGIRFCGAHDVYQLLSGYRERPVTTGKVGSTPRPAFGCVFTAQAMEILTSTRTRDAFDISQESKSVRDSYHGYDDFLLARRLVEAGVPVVTLPARFPVRVTSAPDPGGWDTHAYNFKLLREKLPRYDHAIAALINDLHDRGRLDDTAVVVWGEFGRQPKVGNVTPDGRGHWPAAGFALLAGGGLKTGQIIGDTHKRGERATSPPLSPSNILATLYHVLGINLSQTLPDHAGRPQYLLDDRKPIRELV